MKKILFPTDFSDVANNAFIHALHFAKTVNAELILLHSFDLPIVDNQFTPDNYYTIFDSMQLAQFDLFKEEIPKLRELAKKHHLDQIVLSHKLLDGDLIHCIKQTVKEENIDFVVMGTSGASGWEMFFIGSNTSAVLNVIDVPVLCVPIDAKYAKIENIGFTTRFRDRDKKALKEVIYIAKKKHAKVKCLYVKTSNSDVLDDTIEIWKNEFQNEPVDFKIIKSDMVQETIMSFISHKNIDVLAMITHKRNFFSDLFSPSLTQKFTSMAVVPILAMHEER
jgi:nucleotide-binding universal stress UspA family protein